MEIHITKVDEYKSIEELFANDRLLRVILKLFNKENWTNFTMEEISHKKQLMQQLQDFVLLKLIPAGKITIEPSQVDKFAKLIDKLRQEFNFIITESDKFFDDVLENVFGWENTDQAKLEMYPLKTAYNLMKQVFWNKLRQGKDSNGEYIRYFEHLKAVARIVLDELPNPNTKKLLVALLHDVREDIPGIKKETIASIFGQDVAEAVEELTKKDWRSYLSESDQKTLFNLLKTRVFGIKLTNWLWILNSRHWENLLDEQQKQKLVDLEQDLEYQVLKKKWKKLRNESYFGHLDELDPDILAVKLADRIHNLRTLKWVVSDKKIQAKIDETREYFMRPAYKHNMIAYNLLLIELHTLEEHLDTKNRNFL